MSAPPPGSAGTAPRSGSKTGRAGSASCAQLADAGRGRAEGAAWIAAHLNAEFT